MRVELEVTQEEHDQFMKCEAVIVREYQRPDGSRVAQVLAWGDAEEMHDQASRPVIQLVPVGLTIVDQRVMPVSELGGGGA